MMVEDDQSFHSLFSSRGGGTERDSTYDVQFTVTRVLILCLSVCVVFKCVCCQSSSG